MRELPAKPWSDLRDGPRDEEIDTHMFAGNALRKQTGRNDALAMLGVGAMRELRQSSTGSATRFVSGHCHILHSLKRPEEVETLRRIYGPAFHVVSAYTPRSRRVEDLAKRIALSRRSNKSSDYLATAEKLLGRDEAETDDPNGQNVRKTFPMADIFVDTSDARATSSAIGRFVELLFGNPFHTPTRDEEGMYFAQAAAFRSASLARQVGAVICRADGSIVAIGTNEVGRPGGGQYWPGDPEDGRDFQRGHDSSDRMRENLLADILERLKKHNWLARKKACEPVEALVKESLYAGQAAIMQGAEFTSTIDFVRAVHAEMSALISAARSGAHVQGCTLYSTTFPCHDCAKHIVAAGIQRVVYIEPYPKSLVQELYPDSISVDQEAAVGKVAFEPFVGIAPNLYGRLFALGRSKRKNSDGTVVAWNRGNAVPKLAEHTGLILARLSAEQEEFKRFKNMQSEKQIL